MCVIPTTNANKLLKTEVCQGGTPSPSPVQWITSATTDRRLNLQGHLSTTVHTRQYFAKISPFPFDQHLALYEKVSFWCPSICRNQISIHLHFRYLTRFVQGWVGVGSCGIGEDLHDGYIISDFARLCAFAHFLYFLIQGFIIVPSQLFTTIIIDTFGDDLILYTQQARSCGGGELKGSRSSRLHLCKVPSPSTWFHYPTIFVSFGREPVSPCPDILLYDSRETMSSFKVKSDFKTHPKRATSSPAFSLKRFLRLYRARSCHKMYSSAVVGLWVGLGGNIQS